MLSTTGQKCDLMLETKQIDHFRICYVTLYKAGMGDITISSFNAMKCNGCFSLFFLQCIVLMMSMSPLSTS